MRGAGLEELGLETLVGFEDPPVPLPVLRPVLPEQVLGSGAFKASRWGGVQEEKSPLEHQNIWRVVTRWGMQIRRCGGPK